MAAIRHACRQPGQQRWRLAMKKHLRTPLTVIAIAGAMAVAAFASPAFAQARFGFSFGAPPAVEYESAWVPGHYEWRFGHREWIPGHYRNEPVREYRSGEYWVPGHWVGWGYDRHYVPG